MKLNKIFCAVAIASLAVAFTGCNDEDFLKENYFSGSDATYVTSEAAITYLLNACYTEVEYLMAGNSHGQHSWMLQGMGLDTFTGTSGTAEWAANWTAINVGNGTTRHWYDYLYQLVTRCNDAIYYIDNADFSFSSESMKKQLRAEAVFLKAWAYRCLASMYGTVPIIESKITDPNAEYKPNTRQEVWEYEYELLKEAREDLPNDPRLTGTVVKAAADTYLAEVCLALGKFDEAVTAANHVINKDDGDYHIMTTRFGSRATEATDRYGNSLAAPKGAFWDLFREGGNQDLESGNREAIWTMQYNYGTYETGGGGDSWWRVHSQATEAAWTSGLIVGNQSTVTDPLTGNLIYKYGDNIACYALGVDATSAVVEVLDKNGKKATDAEYDGTPDPKKYVATALGRHLANVAQDSLGARVSYLGQVCVPTRYMWDKTKGDDFNLWKDANDFRGSETMIQRNWYTSGGTRFLDEKAALYARQKAGGYQLTAGDTMNVFLPRLWKFSDDKHPLEGGVPNNKAYDQELYMIRVPEVYLLLAEAYLAQGDKSKAADAINVVRSRAGATPCTANEVDIDYILDERARELLGEEHRWVTLNRLSCNPNCTYLGTKYATQNATSSNTMYERTRRYGRGFENDAANAQGRRQVRTDGYEPYYSNFTPHNYQFPIPSQVIDACVTYTYPQNEGY
ncbi:MAG: RagB/SusD family nutrient uptake outer membrane protein [Bacteroidales bacterium]|nr:RagB/SusD family nutrient uptake outer membrane protein [Bacteroidales bacterium]